MSGFVIEETVENYPFLKGKAERWKIEERYIISEFLFISMFLSVEPAEIRNRLL